MLVRVIAKRTLREHWQQRNRHDSEEPLKAWHREARAATWRNTADLRAQYRSASFVGDRVVFNNAGNKYRLVVRIRFDIEVIFIRFIGAHQEYDVIDMRTI